MKNLAKLAMLSLALTIAGCAKPPQEQVTATLTALNLADDAGADLYVMDMYEASQDSFAAAQIEIEVQNAKNVLTRDYARAEAMLTYAQNTAVKAEGAVMERKEALRLENEALFTSLDETLVNIDMLMTQAPRGKDGAMALAAIRDDANLVRQALVEGRAQQAEGEYMMANQTVKQAADKASMLKAELETAITRVRG